MPQRAGLDGTICHSKQLPAIITNVPCYPRPDIRAFIVTQRTLKRAVPRCLSHRPSPNLKGSSAQAGRKINRRWVYATGYPLCVCPRILSAPSGCAGASESLHSTRPCDLLGVRRSQLRVRVRRRQLLVSRSRPLTMEDEGSVFGGWARPMGRCAPVERPRPIIVQRRVFHAAEADLRPLPQTCMQAVTLARS